MLDNRQVYSDYMDFKNSLSKSSITDLWIDLCKFNNWKKNALDYIFKGMHNAGFGKRLRQVGCDQEEEELFRDVLDRNGFEHVAVGLDMW